MTIATTIDGLRLKCYRCKWGTSEVCKALVALRRLKKDPSDLRAIQSAQGAYANCIKERLAGNLRALSVDEWRTGSTQSFTQES